MFNPLKRKIGRWASDKAFAYYKTQTDTEGKPGSYKDLPRYLEILSNWYSGNRLHHRWVIRSKR